MTNKMLTMIKEKSVVGILKYKVLRAVFPEDYQGILTCAYYLASEGKALCHENNGHRATGIPMEGNLPTSG